MVIQNRRTTTNFYIYSLMACYIFSLLPQVLHDYESIKTIIYAVSYLPSTALMCIALMKSPIYMNKKKMIMAIAYGAISILPLIRNSVVGIETSTYDYIDIIIKILSVIVFFLLIPNNVGANDSLRKLYSGITIITVIASIYNVIINIHYIPSIMNASNSYLFNFSSFFANRNTFAMYLFCGIFSTTMLISSKKEKSNKRWFTALIIEIINMLLTMSRTGIIAMTIFLILMLNQYLKWHKILRISIIVAALFGMALIVSSPVANTIEKLYIRSDAGSSGRLELWEAGIKYSSNNGLITGTGYYTAIEKAKINQYHSYFIDTLVDSGLLGIMIKTSIIIYALINVRRAAKSHYGTKYIIGYMAILAISIFESLNIFALGSTEMIFTILFITTPLAIGEYYKKGNTA